MKNNRIEVHIPELYRYKNGNYERILRGIQFHASSGSTLDTIYSFSIAYRGGGFIRFSYLLAFVPEQKSITYLRHDE